MVFAIVWTARITRLLMMAHAREKIMMLQTYFLSYRQISFVCKYWSIDLRSDKSQGSESTLATNYFLKNCPVTQLRCWCHGLKDRKKNSLWTESRRSSSYWLNLSPATREQRRCGHHDDISPAALQDEDGAPLGRIQEGSYSASFSFLARQQDNISCTKCLGSGQRHFSLILHHTSIQ